MRTTKAEVRNMFARLCTACGKEQGFEIGQWHLAAWSPGDGMTRYNIEEVCTKTGAVRYPISEAGMLGAKEAAKVFYWAALAAEIARKDML